MVNEPLSDMSHLLDTGNIILTLKKILQLSSTLLPRDKKNKTLFLNSKVTLEDNIHYL